MYAMHNVEMRGHRQVRKGSGNHHSHWPMALKISRDMYIMNDAFILVFLAGTTESRPSLTDPAATVVWGGNLPSPRRLILSGATATAVGECC